MSDDQREKFGLTVTGLHAAYDRLAVLHGLDFHVMPGEILALVGANGAGKADGLRRGAFGGFGGMFRVPEGMRAPLLVVVVAHLTEHPKVPVSPNSQRAALRVERRHAQRR